MLVFPEAKHLKTFEAIGRYSYSNSWNGCTSVTFQALDASDAELWRWEGNLQWGTSGAKLDYVNNGWQVLHVDVENVRKIKVLDKPTTSPWCYLNLRRFVETQTGPSRRLPGQIVTPASAKFIADNISNYK